MAGLTNLTELQLQDNNIVDISPLLNLTNLATLYLHHNQIVDITPLLGLFNLTTLDVSYNKIVNTAPLSRLSMLTDLTDNEQDVDSTPQIARSGGTASGDTITISVEAFAALEARITVLEVQQATSSSCDCQSLKARIAALEARPQQVTSSSSGNLNSLADWVEDEFHRLYDHINDLYRQIDEINRKLNRAGIY